MCWFRMNIVSGWEKLEQHGVPHFLLRLPWATHGFDYTLNGPGGQLSTFAVNMFLRKIIE